jgi:hypothetical protein
VNRVVQRLIGHIAPALERRGFALKKGIDPAFIKKTESGFFYFSLPCFSMAGFEVVRCGLGVRHNAVEDIVNQLGHIWGDANRKNTTTVYRGLQFFPFVAGRDEEQIIRLDNIESDSAIAAANIISMLECDGFAFLDRYSSLGECARGLNDPIEAISHPLCNSFHVRAYSGVAASAFIEPHGVADLIQAYLSFMRTAGASDPRMYDVAKDKTGVEAMRERLETVARLALTAGEISKR